MQTAALLTQHRAAYDKLRHLHQIEQFQQIIRDAEAGVILIQLLLEHGNAPQGALQPAGGAHNPHVIPHEQP